MRSPVVRLQRRHQGDPVRALFGQGQRLGARATSTLDVPQVVARHCKLGGDPGVQGNVLRPKRLHRRLAELPDDDVDVRQHGRLDHQCRLRQELPAPGAAGERTGLLACGESTRKVGGQVESGAEA